MNSTITQEPTTEEEAEIKSQIDDALAELKRLNAEMAQDRVEFSRLSLETQEIARESRRIMARTQEIITQLEAS